jgi:hypothetical protein
VALVPVATAHERWATAKRQRRGRRNKWPP